MGDALAVGAGCDGENCDDGVRGDMEALGETDTQAELDCEPLGLRDTDGDLLKTREPLVDALTVAPSPVALGVPDMERKGVAVAARVAVVETLTDWVGVLLT